MTPFSGLIPTPTLLAHHGNPIPKLSFHSNRSTTRSMSTHFTIKPLAGRMLTASMRQQHVKRLRSCCASSREGNYQEWNVEDEYHQESFWLYLFKDAVRCYKVMYLYMFAMHCYDKQKIGCIEYVHLSRDGFRSAKCFISVAILTGTSYLRSTNLVFSFLLEQPSQLKYIEWPGFQSTLRTASLTLVLVALLIIALASTDSALSYILAMLLRRKL